MLVERRGNADRHKIAIRYAREIRRCRNHPGGHEGRKILVHHIADVVLSAVDHVDLLDLDVEANSLEPRFRLFNRKRQAHVTQAHRSANDAAIFHFLEQCFFHRFLSCVLVFIETAFSFTADR